MNKLIGEAITKWNEVIILLSLFICIFEGKKGDFEGLPFDIFYLWDSEKICRFIKGYKEQINASDFCRAHDVNELQKALVNGLDGRNYFAHCHPIFVEEKRFPVGSSGFVDGGEGIRGKWLSMPRRPPKKPKKDDPVWKDVVKSEDAESHISEHYENIKYANQLITELIQKNKSMFGYSN